MNRAETESRLTDALAELDAIYKKYDLAGVFVAYLLGPVDASKEDGTSTEGHGVMRLHMKPTYSAIESLRELEPSHPVLKQLPEHVEVLVYKLEGISKETVLQSKLPVTTNMTRTVAILAQEAAIITHNLMVEGDMLAREMNLSGESMAYDRTSEDLPPDPQAGSLH